MAAVLVAIACVVYRSEHGAVAMKHIHVWMFGSPTYDWQVCRECGAIKPEEHICWTDDTICVDCGKES
jgi:hypothetical protein